ncbi:hypothetical protein LTR66_005131 [Elasticomyces elasticus]|nr:hypothetical protein LTR66_005131 [Elasticomyces elasticus]
MDAEIPSSSGQISTQRTAEEDHMGRKDSAAEAPSKQLQEWLGMMEQSTTGGHLTDVDMASTLDMDFNQDELIDFSNMENVFNMDQLWSPQMEGGSGNTSDSTTYMPSTNKTILPECLFYPTTP